MEYIFIILLVVGLSNICIGYQIYYKHKYDLVSTKGVIDNKEEKTLKQTGQIIFTIGLLLVIVDLMLYLFA